MPGALGHQDWKLHEDGELLCFHHCVISAEGMLMHGLTLMSSRNEVKHSEKFNPG